MPSFQFNGFSGLSAIQRSQEAVSEFSGVGSVETTIFLPAVNRAREQAAHLNGASSSNGTWAALGNIF